jgi:formylglycine-generating enzyme required for sulfatase activity
MRKARAMTFLLAAIIAALVGVWFFIRLGSPKPQQEESREANLENQQAKAENAVRPETRDSQPERGSPVVNPTALVKTQGESTPSNLAPSLPTATNQSVIVSIHQPKDATFVPTDEAATRLELVWIRAGSFVLGSPENEADRRSNEGPQTQVTISREFWFGKYEITMDQFRLTTDGKLPVRNQYTGVDPNCPVSGVGWKDAMSFCAYLTEQERGAGRLPEGYGYRLPTEAESEYACRAGTTTRFSFGDDSSYTELGSYAWFAGNSEGKLHAVGMKLPNAWELYDIYGNAREWCLDDLGPNLPGGSVIDPVGLVGGRYQVFRGGTAADGGGDSCRSAFRYRGIADPGMRFAGFRVALAPELSQQRNRN